jgi:hypothetical protein
MRKQTMPLLKGNYIGIFSLVLLCCILSNSSAHAASSASQAIGKANQVAVYLTDGSYLLGVPALDSIPLQTSFAKMDIPLNQIKRIQFEKDSNRVVVEMRNSDRISGVSDLKSFGFTGVIGKIGIERQYIKELSVDAGGDVFSYDASSPDDPAFKTTPTTATKLSAYDSLVLSLKPVGYYRLDESNGNSAIDLSGNKNNGSYQSAISKASTASPGGGLAPTFKGGYVSLPDGMFIKATTVEAWVRTNSIKIEGVILGYQKGTVGSSMDADWSLALYIQKQGNAAGEMYMGNSYHPAVGSYSINDGKWHHIVLVAFSDHQNLYIDGLLVNTIAGTRGDSKMVKNQIGTGYTDFWGNIGGGWCSFSGSISNVAIYNRALSEAQIQKHYAALR